MNKFFLFFLCIICTLLYLFDRFAVSEESPSAAVTTQFHYFRRVMSHVSQHSVNIQMATDDVKIAFNRIKHEQKTYVQNSADYPPILELKQINFVFPITWHAVLQGPSGTPYEGGRCRLKIIFSASYPFTPPLVGSCICMNC